MKERGIIGVDPGKSGAWAYLSEDHRIVEAEKFAVIGDELNISSFARAIELFGTKNVTLVIEKVHSMKIWGVKQNFNFGETLGKLKGLCQALEVSYELVDSKVWKKVILQSTNKDKDAAIEWAARNFPVIDLYRGKKKPHDGIADALCIAEWGWRTIFNRS